MPTFKPDALRQMAGKVSQPCSPNLFSQQEELTQNRKKWSGICEAQISVEETAHVWGALPCNGRACLPMDEQSLLHCWDLQAESKGTGFPGSFILPELKQERGDALPLQVNDAAVIK